MGKDKVTFRLDPDEMRGLADEARKAGKSLDEVARGRMRAYGKLAEGQEALRREIAELRRECARRVDLANAVRVILCTAGKFSHEGADQWVRENLLK
jgi:phage shock protein A